MAQDTAEQEPTMEEILASIRRIINEDEEQPGEASGEAAAVEPEPAPAEMAEIEPEPTPTPEPEPESELDSLEMAQLDRVEVDIPDPDFEAPDFEEMVEDDDEPLELTERVENHTGDIIMNDDIMIVDRDVEFDAQEDQGLVDAMPANAAAGMFASLSENLKVSSGEGQTLEGIVREMMKPMLKQWLDDNLPSIVEDQVKAEVERISRLRR